MSSAWSDETRYDIQAGLGRLRRLVRRLATLPCRRAMPCRAGRAVNHSSVRHQPVVSLSNVRECLSASVAVCLCICVCICVCLCYLLWYHNRRKISEIAARKSAFADGTLCESGGATASGGGAGGGGGRGGGGESPTLGLKDVLSEALAGVLD